MGYFAGPFTACLACLACPAFRFCEARNLSVDDVDLINAVLTIRSSKFGKSRLVPLHASSNRVLADYLNRRQRFLEAHSYVADHVFINDCGRPLSHDQAIDTFQRLLRKIGVADEASSANLTCTIFARMPSSGKCRITLWNLLEATGMEAPSDNFWFV